MTKIANKGTYSRKPGFLSSLFKAYDEGIVALWQVFAEYPFAHASATEGYEFVLKNLSSVLPLPAQYIYLVDESYKRLVIENIRLAADAEGANGNGHEHHSTENLSHPPLQLKMMDDYLKVTFSVFESGKLLNIPLLIEGKEFIGTILTGPFKENKLDAKTLEWLRHFSRTAAPAVQAISKVKNFENEIRTLQSRSRVSRRMLGSALEVNRFVSLLLDLALSASHSDAGFVAILDRAKTQLTIRAHKNLPDGFLDRVNLTPESGLFEWSPDMSELLIVRDYDFIARFHVKKILAVPLVEKDELLGVFALLDFDDRDVDREFSLTIISTFVEQIKLILKNSLIFENFTRRYLDTLKAMSRAYDMRSPFTVGHSQRVARVAAEIARAMQLSQARIKDVTVAGLVHDVGMCGVTDIGEDYHVDYNHTLIGASMIEMLPISADIVEGVRSHHEWFDGWGYPQGLKGEQIPLSSRILAVAEYYVEKTSNKKIQKSKTWLELHEDLLLRKDKQFDPQAVEAIIRVIEKRRRNAGVERIAKCWEFKGEPANVCNACPAYQQDLPCWSFPDVLCQKHGDEFCDGCFIFKEWLERIEEMRNNGKLKGKKMEYKMKQNNGVLTLTLSGEIDVSVAPDLRDVLNKAIEAGNVRILVDFRDVSFIDSSGLGIFVVYYKKAKARGGTIKFANLSPIVRKVVELTRLDKHFEIYDSVSEAEQSFK